MPDKKFEILDRQTLFQGYFRIDRYRLKQERFAGGWSGPFTREVFERNGRVAAVLPFDPKNDKVVMIEQFRAGIMAAGEHPWITEIVAGILDSGERPEEAARRETLEETGCQVAELQLIADYFASPGGSSEHVSLYAGRIAAPEDGALRGLTHEHEDIRVRVIDATAAINLLYSGKIRDALTLIALQWFAVHHTDLRSRWLVSDVGTPII